MSTPIHWRPGDRARCVQPDAGAQLRHGRLYLVTRAHASPEVTYLTLAPDTSPALGWNAERFAKVVPVCDQGLRPHPDFWKRLDGTGDGF